ncbi:hypothetical protein LZ016_01365 [Sphingomonas sp. SM33]|uniref:Uncharacterized protein n=1 Tax=Sphingomonas telluris TaxID=2907998 RepID=A0ABS9VIG2_9SPHN|nr:hypothetical protein [Sphingomonas telluris]MCH8614757.1 hypothetical protein [Sphingomonas telluris]
MIAGVSSFGTGRWWEGPTFLFTLALLSVVPLLWPEVAPLVDLPGHIGRYRVELDLHSSADLQRYYDFHWTLIGNLGIDLLVVGLAPIFGLELAVKLIVAFIPVLTVFGIFAVGRELHGRVPPTALFAVPFVYGFPFNYGFTNFALSIGLAFLAFALWLRLSKLGKLRLRAIIFAPISCVLWIVHVFGWGFLGLLAFGAEVVRQRDEGLSWAAAMRGSVLQSLPLSLPFAMMILWRTGEVAGDTTTYLLTWKLLTVASALRDRWLVWDAVSVAVALVVISAAMFDPKLEFSRRMTIPTIALAVTFVALPYKLFGSAHADMRLVPYVIIVAIVAIRFRTQDAKAEALVASLGLVFIACRLIGNTISFSIADAELRRSSQGLQLVRPGSAVLTLASAACDEPWALPRHWHWGALVISRRFGFSNDQWDLPGAQLLSIKYGKAVPFEDVSSALVFSPSCTARLNHERRASNEAARTTQESLDQFPRRAFQYVWLIKPLRGTFVAPSDLRVIWDSPESILYQVTATSQPRKT